MPSQKNILIFSALSCLLNVAQADLDRGLTTHFKDWLNANGYGKYGFDRSELVGGSFGGKESDDDSVTHFPIVYFHGNSDVAVGTDGEFNGFTKSIEYFMSKGYKKSELYITTWGPANKDKASDQTHSQEYLEYLRAFTEAVLAYTGSSKINAMGHSMGVTLARRIIKGGKVNAASNPFNLGVSLANKVDTFIGIAGGNYGLTACYVAPIIQTCNSLNGFYPGYAIGPFGLSSYLQELNDDSIQEGSYTFGLMSSYDDLIGAGDIVWGRYTSKWPTMTDSKVYDSSEYTHMKLKELTVETQYQLITNHKFGHANDSNESLFLQ
ncbi:lipase [Stylonychia lemnae]|uniref:Lipase n=1 Tax=Stylonychia lemnae TaxID=5949 RepID=A0A078AMM1_STYLE|nr:lipase [Stylonychia lemnae]|eukprot:CDW83166.1 lipase [Stylonychia lemnae]